MVGRIGCRGDGGGDEGLGVASRPVVGQVECFSLILVECCI